MLRTAVELTELAHDTKIPGAVSVLLVALGFGCSYDLPRRTFSSLNPDELVKVPESQETDPDPEHIEFSGFRRNRKADFLCLF
jgi:hypothetical protein